MKITRIIYLSTIAILMFTTVGCDKEENNNEHTYPPCMQEQIDVFISDTNSMLGAINKYKYKDEIVYIFWEDIANEQIKVVDENCNVIESIIAGGVTGPNPKLKEFTYIETVWEYNKTKE